MAIDFPDSPTVNDTFSVGNRTWQWNGSYWTVVISSASNMLATTNYVDSTVETGVRWNEAVDLATATTLPNSPTYSNGTAGVGATLTAGSNARIVVDGVNGTAGDRVLVKNQSSALQNGIYTITTQGDGSTAYVLTRATDNDASLYAGDATWALSGSTNANQGFILTSEGTGTNEVHTLGTDSLTYTQFTGLTSVVAGTNLSKTGNTLNLDSSLTGLSSVTSTSFTGDLTGDVTGNVTGDVTGNITSSGTSTFSGSVNLNGATVSNAAFNLTGSLTGNVTGDLTGDVYASNGISKVLESGTDGTDATFTGDLTGDVSGNVTGNVTGDLTGDVFASNGTSKILDSGTDGTDATFTGDVTGDVTGNVSGGDLTGDVYASNGTSRILDNGTDGTDATFTGGLTGDVTGNVTGNITSSGTSTFSGTVNLNTATVTNASFNLTGNLTGTADVATSVTATANNATNETVYITFVDGATGSQGIETDTGLSYNPSTGVITTTSVAGDVTGTVTGDLTGDVYASNGTSKVLESGTDGTDATFTGDVTGDLTGDVTGNVTGNLTGNVTGNVTSGNIQVGVTSSSEIDTSTGNLTIDSAGGTVTVDDNLIVSGDLTVNGTTTTVNSTTISVDDKNIELGSVAVPSDVTADGGGITLKGATDKTFNWVDSTDSWTSSEHVDLASGKSYYVNGSLVLSETALATTVGVSLLSTTSSSSEGRIAWDATNDKIIVGSGSVELDFASSTLSTNAQTVSYTLVLADKDKLVEVSNASANTLTVPPNSSVAYPVGTQITVLQTGAGQTTITPGSGVTVNGTPGLKLRDQWSSATLIKRATDTWVAIGDLSD